MNILILNGPPGVGKDTLMNQILKHLPEMRSVSFKRVLYTQTALRYNVDLEWFISIASDRDTKEQPLEQLGGLSPRQALIKESEEHIKPEMGETGVAYYFVHDLLSHPNFNRYDYIAPDGGFNCEVNFIKSVLPKFGLDRVIVIRIDKDGCTFDGDSREYIKNPDIQLINNVDESHLPEAERGAALYNDFLTQYKKIIG